LWIEIMSAALPAARRFSFVERPLPVPGDLRLSWRIPVLLLMLHYGRQSRASLIKLHVLNDAIRSDMAAQRLNQILAKELPAIFWHPRIEPAFARAIDFAAGEGLVAWANGSTLVLSPSGKSVAEQVIDMPDVLTAEKAALARLAKVVTEGFVKTLITASRKA
jgi:hypothetical protein